MVEAGVTAEGKTVPVLVENDGTQAVKQRSAEVVLAELLQVARDIRLYLKLATGNDVDGRG